MKNVDELYKANCSMLCGFEPVSFNEQVPVPFNLF